MDTLRTPPLKLLSIEQKDALPALRQSESRQTDYSAIAVVAIRQLTKKAYLPRALVTYAGLTIREEGGCKG